MASRRSVVTRALIAEHMAYAAYIFESGASEMTGKAIFEDDVPGPGSGGRHVVGRFGGVKKSTIYATFKESPQRLAKAIRRGKGPLYRDIRRFTKAHVLDHDEAHIDKILAKRPKSPEQLHAMVAAHVAITKKCKACSHLHTARVHRGHGQGAFQHRGVILDTSRPVDAPDWWDDVL